MTSDTPPLSQRQRGNQYGFVDELDSLQDIQKNISTKMLNDPDANHTKSVENFFGNFDCVVLKSGPQGFDRADSRFNEHNANKV